MDFDTFLAEMLSIKYATKRRFIMAHQVNCASALPGKTGNTKSAFFAQMLH